VGLPGRNLAGAQQAIHPREREHYDTVTRRGMFVTSSQSCCSSVGPHDARSMDESVLRSEIAALRDLLEQLADRQASREDWDELMDRADGHLMKIAQGLDALLETEGRLTRRVTEILKTPDSDPEADPPSCTDAP
jgi:hypothetical protein